MMKQSQMQNPVAALLKKSAVILMPLFLLAACTGGGPEVEDNLTPNPDPDPSNYDGPAPATDDVQRFKLYVWDNLVSDNRCGACHDGNQSPNFVRGDDINAAYAEANTVVDLTNPGDSRMVEKVGGGHNCWLESNQACADTITSYITNWAGDAAGGTTEVELTDPPIKDPGSSRTFPDDPALFQANVYPLLAQYCVGCHTDSAAVPISPYFASSDISTAYDAAKSKIDLDTPSNSRFVLRLGSEFHNCWDDCRSNSDEMEAAIQAFADAIPLTQVDPDFVISKALTLLDGVPASSGGRYEASAIATYQFKTGAGSTAYDTSGVEPAMNLTLSGSVEWVGGWGINLTGGKAQASTGNSAKLKSMIGSTNEYSLEAWIAPANVTQEGPARIISYSGGPSNRNFMLGQTLYNYNFLNRATNTDAAGEPALNTADADERLQATLQHVVITYNPVDGRRIYVNGQYTGDQDSVTPGTLNDWNDTYAFVVGSETDSNFSWSGVARFISVHNRALTQEQITQNYDAGVGERFFLLFNVSDVINMSRAYVVFEASQYDSYSYLFSEPFFISLDDTLTPSNIPVQGISLGINGKEASTGQAFRNVDISLNETDYSSTSGQLISRLGTVIALEKGPASDEFFLTFDRLGDQTNVRIEADPQPSPTPPDIEGQSDVGVRTFEEIHATMSQITGIPMTNSDVQNVYETTKQALPTTESVDTFSSAQQMAITQLAIEYCSALMDDTTRRATMFPSFDFSGSPATSLNSTGQNNLIDPLLDAVVGQNLLSQPAIADIKTELSLLIGPKDAGNSAYDDRNSALLDCLNTNSCESGRTVKVAKGVCAAALGSAVMLIQ